MNPYTKNPACSCSRCRSGRLFGPAMIITVGVLFLLQENDVFWFHQSWPVLVLVAGLFSFLGTSASTEGHVQPYGTAQTVYAQPAYVQPGYAPTSPVASHGTGTDPGPTQRDSSHNDPNDPTHNDPQVNS